MIAWWIPVVAGLLQAGRPVPGPTATLWLWVAPGVSESIGNGGDRSDLVISLLSCDVLERPVGITVRAPNGDALGSRLVTVPPASLVEFRLEKLMTAAPAGERPCTVVISGMDVSPGWLVPVLRLERGGQVVGWPPGQWVHADPAVGRRLAGVGVPPLPAASTPTAPKPATPPAPGSGG